MSQHAHPVRRGRRLLVALTAGIVTVLATGVGVVVLTHGADSAPVAETVAVPAPRLTPLPTAPAATSPAIEAGGGVLTRVGRTPGADAKVVGRPRQTTKRQQTAKKKQADPEPSKGSLDLAHLAEALADKQATARRAARVERERIPSFLVASFNILGSQHTAGRSTGFARGSARALWATRLLTGRGVSVVGFSEIQSDQMAVFHRNAPSYQVYPDQAAGSQGVPQSLAWDTRVWTLAQARTFTIPFSGQIRPQPVVQLVNNETGAKIWVVNVHNSPEGMVRERNAAKGIEIPQIQALMATGDPVVLTGDFNERAPALCDITAATGLVSAVGGTNGSAGCLLPPGARVDWIFASPSMTVESYVADRSAPIPGITDHAVLFSRLSHP